MASVWCAILQQSYGSAELYLREAPQVRLCPLPHPAAARRVLSRASTRRRACPSTSPPGSVRGAARRLLPRHALCRHPRRCPDTWLR
jgi:hypothetical protein